MRQPREFGGIGGVWDDMSPFQQCQQVKLKRNLCQYSHVSLPPSSLLVCRKPAFCTSMFLAWPRFSRGATANTMCLHPVVTLGEKTHTGSRACGLRTRSYEMQKLRC